MGETFYFLLLLTEYREPKSIGGGEISPQHPGAHFPILEGGGHWGGEKEVGNRGSPNRNLRPLRPGAEANYDLGEATPKPYPIIKPQSLSP